MKNSVIYRLKSRVKLSVSGKNINRFLLRLHSNHIEVLKCVYKDKENVLIVIYSSDYDEVIKLKTIYDVRRVGIFGFLRIKRCISLNRYLIFCFFLGFVFLKFLTSIIFNVDIIYNDYETIDFIRNELRSYGIKEKSFKKSFREISKIKESIINKHRDRIEWLEIETIGTKYVVRLEMRKIEEKRDVSPNRHIVASHDAIIKDIRASRGQIVREINSYVKKGDIIISGNIMDNDVIKDVVSSDGRVFGEVWYEIHVTYPFAYREESLLDNRQNVFVLKFFNRNFEFTRNKFKTKKFDERVLISNSLLPISFVFQSQVETREVEEILTTDLAISRALDRAIKQINDGLSRDEYIINYKVLNTNVKESELELNVFFSVYQDITDYQVIQNNEFNYEN